MTPTRSYSFLDRVCLGLDQAIRAMANNPKNLNLANPAIGIKAVALNEEDRKHSAALMRINHAGEVCAQALYHGQGVVSWSKSIQEKMYEAALEEGDHLAWCKERLDELSSRTSYLNPLWYLGSFTIGMVAGIMGDKWSLGFLAETEHQVVLHLAAHIDLLKEKDPRSFKILEKMQEDEAKHKADAVLLGAKELPDFIKTGMKFASKIMVKTAYWV